MERSISNPGAEVAILAACIKDSSLRALIIPLLEEDFFEEVRNARIYRVMMDLFQKHTLDPQVFEGRYRMLHPTDLLADFLQFMRDFTPFNWKALLDLLIETAIRRRIQRAANELAGISTSTTDLKGMLEQVSKLQEGILRTGCKATEVSREDLMRGVTHRMLARECTVRRMTGFWQLDRHGGYGNINHLITARYKVGKTPVLLRIAQHNAIDARIPVAYWSGENENEELIMAIMAMRTGIELRKIQSGYHYLSEDEKAWLKEAQEQIYNSPLYFCAYGRCGLAKLKTMFQREHEKHGCQIFIIDQLPHIELDPSFKQKNDACDYIADSIFGWKQTMPGWWLIANQLKTKGVEPLPSIHDNMWFTRMEQNCDVGWVIDRPSADPLRMSMEMTKLEEKKRRILTSVNKTKEQREEALMELDSKEKLLRSTAWIYQQLGRMGYGQWEERMWFDPDSRGIYCPEPLASTATETTEKKETPNDDNDF